MASDLAAPRYSARSLAFHSHSRLERNSKGCGNVSVLSVVSIWNTFGPLSRMTLPMRHVLLWSSDACWSMKECDASIVVGLWWWRSER